MTTLTRLTDSGFVLSDGAVIAIDVGEFCDAELLANMPINAAVVSHAHGDHCDPSKLPNPGVPIFAPADAGKLLSAAGAKDFHHLEHATPTSIAGYTITPYAVDHGPVSTPLLNFALDILMPTGVRIWFAGDIRVDSTPTPCAQFDLVIVPIGGQYVFDATEAIAYLAKFPGTFTALGVHYDYDVAQADAFVRLGRQEFRTLVLQPGARISLPAAR